MSDSRPMINLPIPEAHFLAVGRVATHWASIEWSINSEIAKLLVAPECAGLDFNFLHRFSKRVRAWVDLTSRVHHTKPALIAAVEKTAQLALAAKPDRDAVVHSVWGAGEWPPTDSTNLAIAVYRGATLKETREVPMDASAIDAITIRLLSIILEISKIQMALHGGPNLVGQIERMLAESRG
jgi:hypothetical protein